MAKTRKKHNAIFDAFSELKKRNKVAFTIIVAAAIILVWKGLWGIFDTIFDVWIFQGHLFWSNFASAVVGFLILVSAGLVLEKLA